MAKTKTAKQPVLAKTLGRAECEARGLDYEATFRGHFVIGESRVDNPAGWQDARIGGWTVSHCPSLECRRIEGPNGQLVALVLGVAMLPDGRPMPATHAIGKTSFAAIEDEIESLAGRYIALVYTGGKSRLYVDPSCSLVPFYDPDGRRIASCIPLAIDRAREDNPALPLEMHRATPGTYYFFGDTPDAHVRRMLANHYLDLTKFEPTRHWPKPDTDFSEPEDGSTTLDEIMTILRAQVEGLIHTYRCAFPISGGGDSRILLAAAANVLDDVAQYFVHVNNKATGMDSLIATSISERLNIPLQIVSTVSPRLRGAYDRAALAMLADTEELRTSYQSMPPDRTLIVHDAPPPAELILRGGLIEMTRSNKWRPEWGEVTPELGLRALAMPRGLDEAFYETSLPRYAAWMDSLPPAARSRAVDFGHFELWLPATANVGYIGARNHFMINPFNDRRLLHRAARLSYHFRKRGRPQKYLIRKYLPEIQKVPYAGRDFQNGISAAIGDASILKLIGRRFK